MKIKTDMLHVLSLSSSSASFTTAATTTTSVVTLRPYLKRLRLVTRIVAFRHYPFLVRVSSLHSRASASLCCRPSSSSKIFPGSSWFSPMEGIILHSVSWTCYSILIILSGACYTLSNDTRTCKFHVPWLTETQPIAIAESDKRFWSGSGISKNKAMVEQLQQYGVISSNRVAEVMEEIDRGLFVPEGSPAYMDSPMPIGYNATISAPHMHATCLQLLEKNLQPGMHALDIGSGVAATIYCFFGHDYDVTIILPRRGTGYLTACFAMMVGPQGRAVGVEHIPELVADSLENIKKSAAAPLLKEGSLSMHIGDGRLGWPEHAPYDAIHVGAAAPDIPKPLIDQLKPGGRMVIPVGNIFQDLKVVEKNTDGSISVRDETSVRYVPLTSREAQLRDSWF